MLRDKRLIAVAIGSSILVLLYFGIYNPLRNHANDLKANIQSDQDLLVWMQQYAPIVQASRMQPVTNNTKELFGILDTHFRTKPLFSNLFIARLSENRVSINFKDITFNELLKELVFLKKQYNIQVDELQVTRMINEGFVEGRVIVRN